MPALTISLTPEEEIDLDLVSDNPELIIELLPALQGDAGPPGTSVWGGLTGTLSNQTDLWAVLQAKEPTVAAGLSTEYYRGDKTWAALNKAAVGLGNVDNTSDVNKPVSSAQAAINALKADLVAGLVPVAQIPAIAVTEYLGSAANQAAMLALVGQKGDWCTRVDDGKVYVISGNDPTVIGDWTALTYPNTGVWGSITGTLSDQTDLWAALGAKAPTASPSFTGTTLFGTGAGQMRVLQTSDVMTVDMTGATASALVINSKSNISSYMQINAYAFIDFMNNATYTLRLRQNELDFGSNTKLGWNGTGIGFSADASIRRLSSGTLAQREGTTAQSFYQFNTWTDASNNEFGGLRWATNRFELFTDKAGSGSYRDLWILAGNPAGHRLQIAGSLIRDYFGGIVDARGGINLDYHVNLFATTGAATKISSANASMTGQATLELTSNTNTVTTQLIQPNVKDGGGGYTGAGHHLAIKGGKGAAGNNNGGNLDFSGGEDTGTGLPGNIRYGVSFGSLIPGATMATTMTDGFFQLPGAAGAPSGVPLNTTGFPAYWDSTNFKIYIYSGGAWKSTAALT